MQKINVFLKSWITINQSIRRTDACFFHSMRLPIHCSTKFAKKRNSNLAQSARRAPTKGRKEGLLSSATLRAPNTQNTWAPAAFRLVLLALSKFLIPLAHGGALFLVSNCIVSCFPLLQKKIPLRNKREALG